MKSGEGIKVKGEYNYLRNRIKSVGHQENIDISALTDVSLMLDSNRHVFEFNMLSPKYKATTSVVE